jgi:HlyD family secretion protein
VSVLATRTAARSSGGVLFQSAGWVEPRPTPVLVPALAEGVVDQLLVVENQAVQADEPVARLIDADARLALHAAESDLRLRETEADTLIAKIETELLYIPFQIQAAAARVYVARADLEAKKVSPGALPVLTLQRSESELISAQAMLDELQVRQKRLTREAATLRQLRDALNRGVDVQAEIPQPLTEAEVNMKASLNRVRQAQVTVDAARLRLQRMIVRSPSAGRVLALVARPGMRLMGMVPGTQQEAATVVTLYDPKSLQIRADVRLEDVPRVQPGQPARIETPAVPTGPMPGEVLFATSVTDIQKNTLQVKVALKAPPPILKPDMLVQVTFLAPVSSEAPAARPEESEALRLLVPRELVENVPGGGHVWLVDQVAGVARQRRVQTGIAQEGDLIEIVDGLTAADKLIVSGRDGMRDGQRVRITGEDQTLGMTKRDPASKAPRMSRLPVPDNAPKGKH